MVQIGVYLSFRAFCSIGPCARFRSIANAVLFTDIVTITVSQQRSPFYVELPFTPLECSDLLEMGGYDVPKL